MGFYQMENEAYRKQFNGAPTVFASMGMGILAGAFGAMFGNPAEVALIRMMSDNRLPPEERRNYKNVGHAFARIVKDEGVAALWRGCMPTVGRAMIVNMVQLASYSQLKNAFSQYFSGLSLHISAAMMSGLLTTIASMPWIFSRPECRSPELWGLVSTRVPTRFYRRWSRTRVCYPYIMD